MNEGTSIFLKYTLDLHHQCIILILGAEAIPGLRLGKRTFPFLMDDVRCTGRESALIDCVYLPECQIRSCYSNEVAGVRCRPSKLEKELQNGNEGCT